MFFWLRLSHLILKGRTCLFLFPVELCFDRKEQEWLRSSGSWTNFKSVQCLCLSRSSQFFITFHPSDPFCLVMNVLEMMNVFLTSPVQFLRYFPFISLFLWPESKVLMKKDVCGRSRPQTCRPVPPVVPSQEQSGRRRQFKLIPAHLSDCSVLLLDSKQRLRIFFTGCLPSSSVCTSIPIPASLFQLYVCGVGPGTRRDSSWIILPVQESVCLSTL